MYPLGHVTVVCGAVWLGARLTDRARQRQPAVSTVASSSPDEEQSPLGDSGRQERLADAIDYRLVALGALLPDLVDKSIVWVLFPDPEAGGHHIGHSVFLGLALLLAGLVLVARRSDARLALVGAGDLLHILSDSVTHVPHSLLWPFVTLDVPWNAILLRGTNVGGEVAAAVLLFFVLRDLARKGRLSRLIRRGTV